MNKQNITTLLKTLSTLGFDTSIINHIVRQMLLQRHSFTLPWQIAKGTDNMMIHLHFEKEDEKASYNCLYYDACLRKDLEIPDRLIESISGKALEERMASINWDELLSRDFAKKLLDATEKWEEEEKVENILQELSDLESLEGGRELVARLKVKFWGALPDFDQWSGINGYRRQFEISQRFYLNNGEGISVSEAYRFLNNQWLQKQYEPKGKRGRKKKEESSNRIKSTEGGRKLKAKK